MTELGESPAALHLRLRWGDMAGFYGVDCPACTRPIFLGPYSQTIPDVTLPLSEGPIRCPYCDDRTIYGQDRLVYYERLTEQELFDRKT
jgi:hypothetical protein